MIQQVKDISIGVGNNMGGIYIIDEMTVFELNKMLVDGIQPIIVNPNTKRNEDNTVDTFPIMVLLEEIKLEETVDDPDREYRQKHLIFIKGVVVNSWNMINRTVNIGEKIQGYLTYPTKKDDDITKEEFSQFIDFPIIGRIRPLESDDNDNTEENDNKNDDK